MSYKKKHPVAILLAGMPESGRRTFAEIFKQSMPQDSIVEMRVTDIVCEEASKEFYLPIKYFTDKKFSIKPLQPYETFEGYSAGMITKRWEKVKRKEKKTYWCEELFKRMDKVYRKGTQFIVISDWKKIDDCKYLEEKLGEKYVVKIRIMRDLAPSLEEDDDYDEELLNEESKVFFMDYNVRNDKDVTTLYREYIIPISGRISDEYIPPE